MLALVFTILRRVVVDENPDVVSTPGVLLEAREAIQHEVLLVVTQDDDQDASHG